MVEQSELVPTPDKPEKDHNHLKIALAGVLIGAGIILMVKDSPNLVAGASLVLLGIYLLKRTNSKSFTLSN